MFTPQLDRTVPDMVIWGRPENWQGGVTDPNLRSGSFNVQNEFVPGDT